MTCALITGGGTGIGAAFVRELARTGHDVVLVGRDEQALRAVADEVSRAHGVEAEVLRADLAVRADLQRVADRVADPTRPIDILVNNAGFGLAGSLPDTDVADEERLLDVLVRAVLVLSHAAAGAMRARGRGAIVNVSSVAAFLRNGTYSAAKAWVSTFSEGLARDLRPHGVVVTAMCPGLTRTEFHRRAGLDEPATVSDRWWLDADEAVRTTLADVRRGRAVSIPGLRYRWGVAVVRRLPFRMTAGVAARR